MLEFATKLLSKVKLTLRESSDDFNDDIKADIEACAMDLMQAGILSYFFEAEDESWEVDPLILRAVKWYCLSVYGLYNTDMEKYDTAYRSLKATLATQSRYSRNPGDPLVDAEIRELKSMLKKLDLRISDLEDIDKVLSSTSEKAVQNRVVTENIDRIDLKITGLEQEIENAKEIARGKPDSDSFLSYRDMVDFLNLAPDNIYKVNDNILVKTSGIPDFWVFSVEKTSTNYVYIDDQTLANAVEKNPVQIGYYKLAALDGFNKQTLEKFQEKKDALSAEAYLKENGAYTLILTKGFE